MRGQPPALAGAALPREARPKDGGGIRLGRAVLLELGMFFWRAETLAAESRGNYVDAEGKLVALLGVENLIVVDTPDALLVADRARAQQVGELVKRLEQRGREELL